MRGESRSPPGCEPEQLGLETGPEVGGSRSAPFHNDSDVHVNPFTPVPTVTTRGYSSFTQPAIQPKISEHLLCGRHRAQRRSRQGPRLLFLGRLACLRGTVAGLPQSERAKRPERELRSLLRFVPET